jgi:hypothetical protein
VGLGVLAALAVVAALGITRGIKLTPEQLKHIRDAFVAVLVVTQLAHLSFLHGVAGHFGDRLLARGWLAFTLAALAAQAYPLWIVWQSEWEIPGEEPRLKAGVVIFGAAGTILVLWYLLLEYQAHRLLTRALLTRAGETTVAASGP